MISRRLIIGFAGLAGAAALTLVPAAGGAANSSNDPPPGCVKNGHTEQPCGPPLPGSPHCDGKTTGT